MQTHNLEQGSPEWLAHRARIFNASEAPAMMGASKYTTRAALLHEKATGITPDVSPAMQALFDRGHAAEAAARPLIEDLIGDDIAPQVGTVEIDGMVLGASFDGITFMQDTVAEVKLWNEELAAQVRAGVLDMHYVWQLEQELLVSEAERVVFVCTDGTPERFVHMEYRPVPGRREQLLAGWRQFAADLATYTPPAASAVEKIVAEPVEMLPAPVVQVTGTLALQDNFQAFEQRLRTFLADKLIREPKTDQDFVDLDAQIKVMKDARAQLKAAEAQMLAQVQPIDQAKRTKDMLDKLLQQNVSMAENILSAEKERRKGEIVAAGVTALREHIAGLNTRLGQPLMPATASAADFGGAIKGLRSLASMENAVSTVLANAKIAASAIADKIQINLQALPSIVGDRTGLTPDLAQIVTKEPGDFAAVVGQRVAAQREQEERRAAELAERERERIRREEAARVEREAQERAAAERRQAEAAAAAERAAQAAAVPPAPAPTYPPAPPTPPLTTGPANVVPMPTKAPAAALIKLGAINERIAPLSIDAAGLAALGFQPTTQGAAKMYSAADLPRMLAAMLQHLGGVQARIAA